MRLQGWHLVVLLVVILLLFGANRLPDLARSVGQSLKILKTEVKDLTDDDRPARSADQPAPGSHPGPVTPAGPSTPPASSPPDDGTPPRV